MRTLLVVVVGISAITSMIQVRGEDPKPLAQKVGVTSSELFLGAVPRAGDTEVTVLDVTYLPGAINPRHFHPAAVTFHVISGTPVFQEEGKAPVTLKAGDSLLIPAGTTHSHWNPSQTEGVRWLEFIVAEKGKGRSIRKP
jgi:quercetin dioxygenase-like cupin family protein